jgi:8-oxo-dGTP diphosphatase
MRWCIVAKESKEEGSSMISKREISGFKSRFVVVSCFIENDGDILLLHRQDNKPQGNTWGVPAGKVHNGEEPRAALVREIQEEVGLTIKQLQVSFFGKYYVRYTEYDFVYEIYHLILPKLPFIRMNILEHKAYMWLRPEVALRLKLIQDEDFCIKEFYGIKT